MAVSKRLRKISWAMSVAIGVLVTAPVLEAVLVAPHAVFIDHRRRTAQITLANPSAEAEEVEIELVFGYPETDSTGKPYVKLIESPAPSDPSAAGWIRAFPRRVRLEPNQRQVVRLLATPPAGLADGEYWSRMIITSRKTQDLVINADTNLRAGLTLELRTIISLTYRKGPVTTGVILQDLRSSVETDSLIVWVDLEREGGAAFLGTVRFTISNEQGREIAGSATPIAVYYTQNRRFAFPVNSLPSGSYSVRFAIDTEREDLQAGDVLPATPVERTFGFRIE